MFKDTKGTDGQDHSQQNTSKGKLYLKNTTLKTKKQIYIIFAHLSFERTKDDFLFMFMSETSCWFETSELTIVRINSNLMIKGCFQVIQKSKQPLVHL